MSYITSALVSPPVSGVVYFNPTAINIVAHIQFALNPTAGAAASMFGEISPDGIVWTTLTRYTIPAGFVAIDGAAQMAMMLVPAGYFYRLTGVNSTFASIVGVTEP